MNRMYFDYLSDEQLQGFEKYKYSAIDTNPLGVYVMQPYFNNMIQICPRWIAPNLLTFIGFLFAVSAYVLFAILDYGFYASSGLRLEYSTIPDLAYLYAAIAIFMNYTLDGLDGKQARRTGTSGPLGELFDHGLDSWTTFMIPCLFFSVFSRDPEYGISTFRLYCICWNVFLSFYLSHVEKYITGVLYLPWSYDYAMLGTVFILLCTYITGFHSWKFFIIGNYTAANILEIIFYAGSLILNIPIVIWNIYWSYAQGTGRQLSFWAAFKPLIPFLMTMAIFFTWVTFSPRNIVVEDPRSLYALTGTLFSHICCRLIISQMSGTECVALCWLMMPPVFGFATSLLFPIMELLILRFLNVFTLLFHIHYGVCVILQMTQHFGIKCFSINNRK